jgi:hypothetical protein
MARYTYVGDVPLETGAHIIVDSRRDALDTATTSQTTRHSSAISFRYSFILCWYIPDISVGCIIK